jgi:DNA mismatch repair protein MutS2
VSPRIPRRTIDDLGLPRVLDHLGGLAWTEVGRAACRALPFLDDPHAVRRELKLVSDARRVLSEGTPPAFEGLIDLSAATRHVSRGGYLIEEDLVALGRCLDTVARLRRTLEAAVDVAPDLARLAGRIDRLDGLAREILRAFDDTGRLRDEASPRLYEARSRQKGIRTQIRKQLDEYLLEPNLQDCFQGDYFTLRDARYVLPVKTSLRVRVPGILHGASNTGETVYIEPELIVSLNNGLMLQQEDVLAAEIEVLTDLSSGVRDLAEGIDASVVLAVRLETLAARARLSLEWDGAEPAVTDEGPLKLNAARNPLLLMQGLPVVPNDLCLAPGVRFLVISGPNAGGKTVSLDTLGLCLALVSLGMHVPADPDSLVFVPTALTTLMGESQDIERSLSTFTGQLKRIEEMLASVGPRDVVLVDEVLAGTDPNEGAALAWACLERFADRGLTGAVTTHYELLKTLPYADPRFVNAAMLLDPRTHRPNYRLSLGAPGASSPLRVAADAGFDADILARASEILGTRDERIDEIIRRMEDEARALEVQKDALEAQRLAAVAGERELERRLAQVERDARMLALEQKERFLDKLKQQEEELKAMTKRIQDERSPETVRRVKVDVERLKQQVARDVDANRAELQGKPQRLPARPESIVPGARLLHATTGKLAEVVTVDRSRRTAFLRIGALGLKARFDDLLEELGGPAPAPTKPSTARPRFPERSESSEGASSDELIRTDENTISLIGCRIDEALAMLEKRLDRDSLQDREVLFVAHGIGTGRLRDAVRDYLKKSDYVATWAKAPEDCGGEAATVVRLK